MRHFLRRQRAPFALLFAAGLALSGCRGRAHSKPKSGVAAAPSDRHLAEVDLSAGVPESTDSGGWFPLPATQTWVGLIRSVERLTRERVSSALFVKLGGATLGYAQVEELAQQLHAYHATGRPVICHAHELTNTTVWLTSVGCDRIWLSPAGGVEAIGIAAQMVYLKGLLDHLNVRADFLSIGRFKSAAEPMTREGPSDAAREELLTTLGSIRDSWRAGITKGRPGADAWIESGPYGPEEARKHQLIDELGDEAAARADAKKRGHVSRSEVAFGHGKKNGGSEIAQLVRLLAGSDDGVGERPHIAVLPAVGGITMGSAGLFSGDGIVHGALAKTIERLAKDDSVRAVVLRIDSPGGSALASDLLWLRLRELAARKPLIASVGGMAASGGYFLAVASQHIIAERTSIVGSIGVVGGKIAVGAALEPYGVHAVTMSPNPAPGGAERAAYLSVLTPWDDATRERVRANMLEIYELFVARVAEGRHLPLDRVRGFAEGRIFSGAQGKELGLVDELGGLAQAITVARQRAGLPADCAVTVEGAAEGLLSALGLDEDANAQALEQALLRKQAALWSPLRYAPRAWTPWLTGVAPLLGREHVLAVLPMAVTLE